MSRLGILADDLTGAVEAAVACRRLGHRAVVMADPEAPAPRGAAVVVLDTASRHAEPEEARRAVRNGAAALRKAGCSLLHKKTDSTLRGNIAAELGALLETAPERTLVYAPAFPAAGRVCRGGLLHVHGVPVAQTSFADDPLCPVTQSSVPKLLRRDGRFAVGRVSLKQLRAGADLKAPGRFVVVDGETDEDVARAARASRGAEFLHAGPSAFAEEVARTAGLPPQPRPQTQVDGPWLVLCGSLNEVSLAQVRAAMQTGAVSLKMSPQQVFCRAGDDASLSSEAGAVRRAWHQKRLALLLTTVHTEGRAEYLEHAAKLGLDAHRAARRLTEGVADLCARLMDRLGRGNVLVLGGETSRALADRLGVRSMEAVREVVRGAGVLQCRYGDRPLLLATKSGGFGNEDFLEEFKKCCWE
jgi:uncharacterized protein YgbK (DUF1537 family)